MTDPVLFADVDGCLNRHEFDPIAQSCNISRDLIQNLNRVLHATSAKLVISSAWRYMVMSPFKPAMTLLGFAYMLRTHGLTGATQTVIGCTEIDEVCPRCDYRHKRRRGKWECRVNDDAERVCIKCGAASTRGRQIAAWRRKHGHTGPYVVVDDIDLGISDEGHPFVQCDPQKGLTAWKAGRCITLLRGQKKGQG